MGPDAEVKFKGGVELAISQNHSLRIARLKNRRERAEKGW